MKSSKYIMFLGIFVVFIPFIPILFYVTPLSIIGNCYVNEGSINPCIILGHDFGESLYSVGMLGWFSLVTFPIGGLIVLTGLIKFIFEKLKK